MEFYEVLEECENIRRRVQCRDDVANFDFQQKIRVGGKWKMVRTRVATILLYPENNLHFEVLKRIHNDGYSYAGIIHDSDLLDAVSNDEFATENNNVDDDNIADGVETEFVNIEDNSSYDGVHKKTHIHAVLYFLEARTNTAVAKSLGISSNMVKMFHNLNGRLAYLTHRDNMDKYQYSPNRVFGNMATRIPSISSEYGRRSVDLLFDVLNIIKNWDKFAVISSTSLYMTLIEKGYDSVLGAKYRGVIRDALYEHNRRAIDLKQLKSRHDSVGNEIIREDAPDASWHDLNYFDVNDIPF